MLKKRGGEPQLEFNIGNGSLYRLKGLIRLSELFCKRLRSLSNIIRSCFGYRIALDQFIDDFVQEFHRLFQSSIESESEAIDEILFIIRQYIEKQRRDGHSELVSFFEELSDSIRKDNNKVENYILESSVRGINLSNQFILLTGKKWSYARKEKIKFESGDIESNTPAYYDREKNTIYLIYRYMLKENVLYDIFNLPFIFYHEYLSHVMPPVTNLPKKFTDGWLFWLQCHFYINECNQNKIIDFKRELFLNKLQEEFLNSEKNESLKIFYQAAMNVHLYLSLLIENKIYLNKLFCLTSDLMEVKKNIKEVYKINDFHSYLLGTIWEPIENGDEYRIKELLEDLRNYEDIYSFYEKIRKKSRIPFT